MGAGPPDGGPGRGALAASPQRERLAPAARGEQGRPRRAAIPDDRRVSLVLAESGTSVGGTERALWELATRLPAARYAVRVWLAPAAGVDELAVSLARRGIAVERVPEVDSLWDLRGMFATWSRLRRARPALLHIHHVGPSADRYLPFLARAAGVPHLVVTEHLGRAWDSGARRAPRRRALNGPDAVTAVCRAVAESLVRDCGIERARVRVVPNGADPPDEEREAPAARRLREEFGVGPFRPLWVCPGRLEEHKGQAVLLEALARLREGHDFVAVLAGEGSLQGALERRVARHALAPRVRFLRPREAVGPLLRAADACLFPSLWEGLPLTLLEAMVRARPVVASRVGGMPEVIEDGVTGRLVPGGDAQALAAVLEDFHRRPDAARRLGLAAAERARAEFTWPRAVEAFEAVYDEVLGLASFSMADRGPRRGAPR